MNEMVLILGASTRAAAQSAVRAGLRPVCADLFADQDLRAIAEVLPLERYPHDLPSAARRAPHCPWMYTGALENHPQTIEAISAERPLWGNQAEVIRGVRDPFLLSNAIEQAGLPTAGVRRAAERPTADGSWLLKPLRSAAGRGIAVWDANAANSPTLREPHYFQRRLAGRSISAVYVAFSGGTVFMGISEQLIVDSFRYAGTIGPMSLAEEIEQQVRRTGEVVAGTFGLRGLFGCDFVVDGARAWLVEVNPRYTASVEVYEHAYGAALVDLHRRACEETADPAPGDFRARVVVGKSIVYAERDVRAPSLSELITADNAVPALADIPAPGTLIEIGHPICTVLASGNSQEECCESLQARVDRLRRELFGDLP